MNIGHRSPLAWVLFVTGALAILLVANGAILKNQRLLTNGTRVLLPLRPTDPRSIMQGDYMALAYSLSDEIQQAAGERHPTSVMLKRAPNGVATLSRLAADATVPAAGEVRLRIKWDEYSPRLPSDAYFFQEGRAARFAQAKFAVYRVAPDGKAILEALADEMGTVIAP